MKQKSHPLKMVFYYQLGIELASEEAFYFVLRMMDDIRTYFLSKNYHMIGSLDLEIPTKEEYLAWIQFEQGIEHQSVVVETRGGS